MLKLKYHIIFIALLFSGAMSFSQERFKLAIEDSLSEGAVIIRQNQSGYKVYALKGNNGGSTHLIYNLDHSGNVVTIENINYHDTLNSTISEQGNFYFILGSKDSSNQAGGMRPYITRISDNLDTLWTYHWNTISEEGNFKYVTQLADSCFLVAGVYAKTSGLDYLMMKFDSLGNEIWNKQFDLGNGDTQLLDIIGTPDGGAILSGATNSFGIGAVGGSYDIYLRKVDSLGNFQWHNTWGGNGGEAGFSALYTDSTIIVHGGIDDPVFNLYDQYFAEVLISNGQTLWDTTFALNVSEAEEGNLVSVLSNGSFVCAGFYMDDDIQNPAGFLLKFNSNKQVEWIRKYKIRTNDHYFRDLIQTSDGGFAMTGFVFPDGTGNTQDTWVVKVDSMGCDVPLCYLGERELGLELPILKCYPNPTSSISTVELLEGSREIQLYNSAGILQKKYEVSNGQKSYKLDLSLMPHDIYILRLLDKNGATVGQGKVVKQ